jgi:hypothetical protein
MRASMRRTGAVVVGDRAGGHTSGDLVVPDGIDLVPLPALTPAERRWPLLNEAVANRAFADLEAMEEPLVRRCRALRTDRATVRALTRFHWWPTDAPLAIPN